MTASFIPTTASLKTQYQGYDYDLSYFVRPGREATLLFLHGLGCSKDDFLGAVEHPALRDYTLIGLDFPGSGSSSYYREAPLDVDALIDFTHLFVEALNLRSVTLVGHSMGGLVALRYLMAYSNAPVCAFVNVEGNLAPEDCLFTREVVQHEQHTFVRDVFPALIERLETSVNPGTQCYAESLAQRTSVYAYYDYSPSIIRDSNKGRLLDAFRGLRLPRLFVYGSENAGLSYVPALREAGCTVVTVPGSHHFPFHDAPEFFYRRVATFVAEQIPR